jgi:hypothetical protein
MSAFADTDSKESVCLSLSNNTMRAAVIVLLACVATAMAAVSNEPPKQAETPPQAPPPKMKKNGKSVLLWTFPYATSHNLVFAKVGRELAARGYTVCTYKLYTLCVHQWLRGRRGRGGDCEQPHVARSRSSPEEMKGSEGGPMAPFTVTFGDRL